MLESYRAILYREALVLEQNDGKFEYQHEV